MTAARADVSAGAKLLNVGVSFEGLRALGVDPVVLEEFPDDFNYQSSRMVGFDLACLACLRLLFDDSSRFLTI